MTLAILKDLLVLYDSVKFFFIIPKYLRAPRLIEKLIFNFCFLNSGSRFLLKILVKKIFSEHVDKSISILNKLFISYTGIKFR